MFWVGEEANETNGFISNLESAWDSAWLAHFGGVDDPNNRCGYRPCGFTPLENPFYFALPYNDLDEAGDTKTSAAGIPWYEVNDKSILKNKWIEVKYLSNTCYAQWEDVGPFGEDDFAYVFGSGQPANTMNNNAGLDVSPALFNCLGMADNDISSWRFVAESEVPAGPWKDIISVSESQ